jgi:hypothetical protein
VKKKKKKKEEDKNISDKKFRKKGQKLQKKSFP